MTWDSMWLCGTCTQFHASAESRHGAYLGGHKVAVTKQTLGNGSAVLRPDGSYADEENFPSVVVILTVSTSADRPAHAEGFIGGLSSNSRRSL